MQALAFLPHLQLVRKIHTSNWKHFGHSDVFISTQVWLSYLISSRNKVEKAKKKVKEEKCSLGSDLEVLTSNVKSLLWFGEDE